MKKIMLLKRHHCRYVSANFKKAQCFLTSDRDWNFV